LLCIELLDSGPGGPKCVGNAIKWLGYPNLSVDSLFSDAQFWSLGRTRHRWKNIKVVHKEIG